MRKHFFLFIILLSLATSGYAANIKLVAEAPDAVAVGDQFRITYTVNTQNVSNFRAPSINGFEVLAGPFASRMSSSQNINGRVSSVSSITYTYTVQAVKKGSFSIAPASIIAEGKPITSNALRIRVLPSDQKANSSNSSRSKVSSTKVSDQDLMIVGSVSKTNVYEQEAFLLTYKIYTLVNLSGFDNVKLPDFKGFQSQEITPPEKYKFTLERFRGKNYQSTVYRQFILFPQSAGKLSINAARFDALVVKTVRTEDPFDAIFNGGGNVTEVRKTILTPQINVNVKSLPSGKPADFSGGVGEFRLTSSINSKEVKTNDAVTIKINISGIGNIKLIETPKIDFPKDFEIYDPKVSNKFNVTRNGLSGTKEIEYLVIPRNAGDYKIPPISFSYFDSSSNSYKTIKTQEYSIKVVKGAGNASQVIANFTNKEDLKLLGQDIRYIKTGDVSLIKNGNLFFGSLFYYLCYVIPACLFLIFVIIYRKQVVENTNIAKTRTKRANKVASKRMNLAEKLLKQGNKELFYDEVLKALWGYVSDKLSIPVSQLTKENVDAELSKYGVQENLTKELLSVLDQCEFARYAPGDKNEAMSNIYSSAIQIISKIESIIKH